MEEYMLPCTNKWLFGIDCIGCGLQRAVILLLKGEFLKAFHMFPAIYPMLILISFVFFNLIGKKQIYQKWIIFWGILTGITMLVAYGYKIMLKIS